MSRVRRDISLIMHKRSGQASLEYALVAAGCIAITLCLAALWRSIATGTFLKFIVQTAPHNTASDLPGIISDILLY